VGHVHLFVGDLPRAAAFYHEALGLERTVWNYPGALFMSAGDYHHHLGVNSWASTAPAAGDDDARLLDWELVLPSAVAAEEAALRVEAAGFPVARAGAAWLATDPWGTVVRLVGEGE
jgi:catechol 2,3-dioxygenase